MMQKRLEAPNRAAAPAREVSHDILDRPATGDLWLRHMSLPNLVEQAFPGRLFRAQFSEELRFAARRSHAAFLSFGTVCATFPQSSTKSRKKSPSERDRGHFMLLQGAHLPLSPQGRASFSPSRWRNLSLLSAKK